MLLLQWQQQALRLLLRSLHCKKKAPKKKIGYLGAFFLLLRLLLRSLVTPSRDTCFFCNGNNKPGFPEKSQQKRFAVRATKSKAFKRHVSLPGNAFKGHVLLLFLLRKNKRSTCPLKALPGRRRLRACCCHCKRSTRLVRSTRQRCFAFLLVRSTSLNAFGAYKDQLLVLLLFLLRKNKRSRRKACFFKEGLLLPLQKKQKEGLFFQRRVVVAIAKEAQGLCEAQARLVRSTRLGRVVVALAKEAQDLEGLLLPLQKKHKACA